MTDDLIIRLIVKYKDSILAKEAADRIAALEAQLEAATGQAVVKPLAGAALAEILRVEFSAIQAALQDPVAVHANMLRGTIAKPSIEQIIHLYGVDALCKALAPVIVREATPSTPIDLSQSAVDDMAWTLDHMGDPGSRTRHAAAMLRALKSAVMADPVAEAARVLLAKIETYGFECEAGRLNECQDWIDIKDLVK